MRQLLPLSLVFAGCPWIGFEEHRVKREALTETDADTDADSDTDTDADTDTDTDPTFTGDTAVPCLEDEHEPNDFAAQAPLLTLPAAVEGVLCPEDLGEGGAPVPTDAYAVQVGASEVLVVEVQAGATTGCEAQTFEVELSDDDALREVGSGPCPTLYGGAGPGRYVVQLRDPERVGQDYTLALSTQACADADDDGALDARCGGQDCNDLSGSVGPDFPEVYGDGVDQDCDGRDDLDGRACAVSAVGSPMQGEGALDCGDLESDPVWDAWRLPAVPANASVSIAVQNGAGSADLLAYVVQPEGASHYGLQSDRSQFDDELTCPQAAWTGDPGACPGACYLSSLPGRPVLWVAQHQGSGCTDGAAYRVVLRVDGVQVAVSEQISDDVVLTR